MSYLQTVSIILLLVLLCPGTTYWLAVAKTDLVDVFEPVNKTAANELCHSSDRRIFRISSIKELIEHFDKYKIGGSCEDQWLEPLRDLQDVLEASSKDACSRETIEKIYEFHWYYIVGTLKWSWRKAARGSIPEPLRLFFLNFAQEVTEKCSKHLSERLGHAVKLQNLEKTAAIFKRSLGPLLDSLSLVSMTKKTTKNYDDFFLIFNSILASEKKKGYDLEKAMDLETGEAVYMSLKVHDASGPRFMQRMCREKLRPVYAITVLPVMQLIDMGFGSRDQRIADDLVKEWYGITQLCELALPIRFYSSGISEDGSVSLVSGEQSKLDENTLDPLKDHPTKPVLVEVPPVHLDDVLAQAGSDRIIKQVTLRLKSRGKIYRKAIKHTLYSMKSGLKSKMRSIFMKSRLSNHNQLDLENSLAQAEKELYEDERFDMDLVGARPQVRHKRYASYYTAHRYTMKMRIMVVLGVFIAMLLVIMTLGHAG